ncbi:plastocyanin/azurin family copper-binding protein [Membranihabitans marinus]|uniref:plastocyanin/azurin family copper-binding protein n=1 Tax=Membranihabitans marinus TaxID=1227546 RepID=UPI001F0082AB|nr:plastocyanin/azurin family copper-binding protein [Membranihabitans marinus]
MKSLKNIWLSIITLLITTSGSISQTVELKAVGGLQYDVVRFKVKPGGKVKLVLKNTDDMDHNLVITEIGAREKVVKAAFQLAEKGPKMEFIPDISEVLYSIGVISPGEEKTLTFTAPSKEGVYPYVCTYPGHGSFMFGAMYVTNDEMPELSEDLHVPESRRSGQMAASSHDHHTQKKFHPYETTPPYMYRIFMPDSGPASIAVRLSEDLSYCWDAVRCQLRYAWSGEFVDPSEPWSIKGDAMAKVLGEKFYIENENFPLHIGNSPSEVEYRGYRLNNDGFPEFLYTVNGYLVHELLLPMRDNNGILRKFRIPDLDRDLVVESSPQKMSKVSVSKGSKTRSGYELSAGEGKSFELSIDRLK